MDSKGVRLPKLDVPTFDGNILNWTQFREQFSVSVQDRPVLSDSEKLVYLQHALKDGSAKKAIEGMTGRLIHRTHVRMIMVAPPPRDGSGKELRRLHDTIQQHLHAKKAMDCEPSGPFVTSIIELKLDTDITFEWQRHSQAKTEVPHYQDLLDFIDLQAQASETYMSVSSKKALKNDLKDHHLLAKE